MELEITIDFKFGVLLKDRKSGRMHRILRKLKPNVRMYKQNRHFVSYEVFDADSLKGN